MRALGLVLSLGSTGVAAFAGGGPSHRAATRPRTHDPALLHPRVPGAPPARASLARQTRTRVGPAARAQPPEGAGAHRARGWRSVLALLRIQAVLLLDRFFDRQQDAASYNAGLRFLTGAWEPVLEENSGLEAKIVEGALPSDLRGVFLRIGPNPPVPPTKRHHVFDGEGMIHSVRFHQGRVLYNNWMVETEKMRFERELGEPFFTRIGELYGVWGLAKAILTIPHRQTRELKPPEVVPSFSRPRAPARHTWLCAAPSCVAARGAHS